MTADEPLYIDPELVETWEAYLASVSEDGFLDISEFLEHIDEPTWIAFENEYLGVQGDAGWIVLM